MTTWSGWPRTASRTARLFAVVLIAGCMTTGQSMSDIKKELQASFLYRSVGMFSDGSATGPFDVKGTIPKAQRDAITAQYQQLVKALLDAKTEHAAELAKMFPSFDTRRGTVRVTMPDRNLDAPTVAIDGSITVDTKVARLMFRDAVLSAMRSNGLGSVGFMDGWKEYCGSVPHQDAEYLDCFLELRQRVDRIESRGVIGSIWGSIDGNLEIRNGDGSWFNAAGLKLVSQELQLRYAGVLLFVTAHEIGHVVLGHLEARRTGGMNEPEAVRNAEREADAFAVALIAYATPQMSMFQGMSGLESIGTGYEDFFRNTYRNASWADETQSHPSSQERLTSTRAVYASIRSSQADELWERVLQEMQKQARQ
jgi:hypothetical protein